MVKAIFALLGGFCVYMMGTLGYAGIAVLMGIESACIPLPSELIMPYAGAMTEPSVAAELSLQFHVALPVFNLIAAGVAGALRGHPPPPGPSRVAPPAPPPPIPPSTPP